MDSISVDTIICPGCHAELAASAVVCQQCGASTDSHPPRPTGLLHRPWVLVVLVLHLGFFGIPIYWKLQFSKGVRLAIIAVSIIYTVIAVLIIWWGIVQIWTAVQSF